MKYLLIFTIVFPFFTANSQSIEADFISTLDNEINETSGLIFLEGRLITHNDSGDDPFLYEIDTTTGSVTRTVFIENALNRDWEDLALNDTHIFIGDFGNNNGNRTNLAIYRIAVSDYMNALNDTLLADTILFEYADQTDFTNQQFSTNFDAEAFIAYNDQLYLFTKNWGDSETRVYEIPSVPGSYSVNSVTSFDVQGLVTGATINLSNEEVILVGYGFTFRLKNFVGNQFFSGQVERNFLALSGSIQVEAVCPGNTSDYFITTETFQGEPAVLYHLEWPNPVGVSTKENQELKIYPNPTKGSVQLELTTSHNFVTCSLYSMDGKLVHHTNEIVRKLLLPAQKGVYILQLKDAANKIYSQKIIIQD